MFAIIDSLQEQVCKQEVIVSVASILTWLEKLVLEKQRQREARERREEAYSRRLEERFAAIQSQPVRSGTRPPFQCTINLVTTISASAQRGTET